MLETMKMVDWKKYSRQGLKSPDFESLIHDLSSEHELTRLRAMTELEKQLEWAYEKAKNDLPYEIVPVLIEFLQSQELAHESAVTSLLLFLVSYSEFPSLKEPHKSEALRLKKRVCEGMETYRLFLEDKIYKPFIQDNDTKDDINSLVECCKD